MKRHLMPVAVVTAVYMLLALGYALSQGNTEFLFYIVVVLVLGAIIWQIDQCFGIPTPLLWLLSLWGALHMAGGLVPLLPGMPYNPPNAVLYSWWLMPDLLKYDHVVHALGFGICTALCWYLLKPALSNKTPRWTILSLAIFGGMGLGAANEIVEFIAVLAMPNTNVGGYVNTGWDLVSNLVGSLIAAVIVRYTDA